MAKIAISRSSNIYVKDENMELPFSRRELET